jgi:hypothetical protein
VSALALFNIAPALALVASLDAAPDAWQAVQIRSDSSCPSGAMVRDALNALGRPPSERRATVTIETTSGRLRVAFGWDGASPTDVRELEAPVDCPGRAETAAVVASSWLGLLPASPAVAPPPPTVGAAAAPAVQPVSAGASPVTRQSWLGVGLGAAAAAGIVPAARAELARLPEDMRGFGWAIAAQLAMPRRQTVGVGTSSWMRPALGVAAGGGWSFGRLALAADAGALAGVTFAWGDGYPSNQNDQALAFGLSGGLRLTLATTVARPWAEVRLVGWPTAQRLRFDAADGTSAVSDLPPVELNLTLGWSLSLS